jgi:glycosyltransferase involved in cell wall biosynthesis
VTGEYPPQPGGVSDYCAQLARALAEAGDAVHVWAPPVPGEPAAQPGVQVHRLTGRYDPAALWRLGKALNRTGPPRRLLVQYVAGAWGFRGLNVLFPLWLASRRRDAVWVMFHEYAYPFGRKYNAGQNLLGLVTPAMAAAAAAAADRVFVSTADWVERIPEGIRRRLRHPVTVLPIPSNVPESADPRREASLRARLRKRGASRVIGHFGTFGPGIAAMLRGVLPAVLAPPDRVALLIGRGGPEFALRLAQKHPWIEARLVATGGLPVEEVASHLRACDVLLQPYPDGATSRRGSLMAGLCLGMPVVTNAGERPEAFMDLSEAAAVAPGVSLEAIAGEMERVLASPVLLASMGARARALYEARFALRHTVGTLRSLAEADDRGAGHR